MQAGQGSILMPTDSPQAWSLSLIHRDLTPLQGFNPKESNNIITVLLFKILSSSQTFSEQKITEKVYN